MLLKNSIQAGLGGSGLPTAIKKAKEVVTDFCNFVPVKEYKTHTVDKLNFSVFQFPINLVGDGSVHLAFDLPHWLVSFG